MGSGPKKVYIIRHGEKLGDASSDKDGGPDLSVQGSARAAYLPILFADPKVNLAFAIVSAKNGFAGTYGQFNLGGSSPRFDLPGFLFASKASSESNRPVETVTPLASALNLTIDQKHSDSDYKKVADDILKNSKYQGAIILVCWHHGNIPNLANELGVSNPPPWDGGTIFDRVWEIDFSNSPLAVNDQPQQLLYTDSET